MEFPGPTRHFRPWFRIDADGSLSTDSFRARPMLLTAESSHEPTSRPLPGTDRQCSFIRELPAGRAEVSAATKDALAKSEGIRFTGAI